MLGTGTVIVEGGAPRLQAGGACPFVRCQGEGVESNFHAKLCEKSFPELVEASPSHSAGGLTAATLCGCISEAKGHLDRARILFDRRDLKAARLELTAALKADPGMLEARKLLARVDEYLGDQQDAALQYEAAARLDPADARLRNKARFYRQQVEHRSEPSGKVESLPGGGFSVNAPIGRGRQPQALTPTGKS